MCVYLDTANEKSQKEISLANVFVFGDSECTLGCFNCFKIEVARRGTIGIMLLQREKSTLPIIRSFEYPSHFSFSNHALLHYA